MTRVHEKTAEQHFKPICGYRDDLKLLKT